MAIQIAAVANSIQGLTVTGLTIFDVDNIPAAVDVRQYAALVPLPDYITGMEVIRDSYGTAGAKMTITYTLNYRLFYSLAGAGRAGVIEYYDGMVDMIAAIWDAILAINTLTGALTVDPVGVSGIGVVMDAANNSFLGCDLSFLVTEFVN
jgi:hypothetical protein